MVWDDRFNKTARFQLAAARLCLDCEVVYEGDTCPACDSRIFYKLTDAIPAMLHPCAKMDEPTLFVAHTKTLSCISKGADIQAMDSMPDVNRTLAKAS